MVKEYNQDVRNWLYCKLSEDWPSILFEKSENERQELLMEALEWGINHCLVDDSEDD